MMVAAPLFYVISEKLYQDDADEALVIGKIEFLNYTLPQFTESDIAVWNKINQDVKILPPIENLKKDTLFYTTFYESLTDENEPYHVLNAPIRINGKNYTYSAKMNLIENEDLILSILLLFAILIFLLLGGLYLITRRLSLQLWNPFYATLARIEQFEIDKNTEPEFIQTTTEEFERLNAAISKLIIKNTKIYKNQREFIENAAHELQTPLAIFQGHIDMLFQNEDITEAQSAILGKLTETAARFNRLNKNLLLLSKIDKDHYNISGNVNINEVLEKNRFFFLEQAKSKHIAVTIDIREEVMVQTNLVLMEIVISNLFMNAIRHNIPNGKIDIFLDKKGISFRNTGKNESLAAAKLFERFSKISPSSQGNGLGLAIIKRTADTNGWKISYGFKDGLHHFELQF
jgi:signal transduction histidine kinase